MSNIDIATLNYDRSLADLRIGFTQTNLEVLIALTAAMFAIATISFFSAFTVIPAAIGVVALVIGTISALYLPRVIRAYREERRDIKLFDKQISELVGE